MSLVVMKFQLITIGLNESMFLGVLDLMMKRGCFFLGVAFVGFNFVEFDDFYFVDDEFVDVDFVGSVDVDFVGSVDDFEYVD